MPAATTVPMTQAHRNRYATEGEQTPEYTCKRQHVGALTDTTDDRWREIDASVWGVRDPAHS
jgi:hypothetical protein